MDQPDIQPRKLDHFTGDEFSPYRFFSADEWAEFRADTPLTLTEDEVRRLRSLNDPVDLDEVRRIYRLRLCRRPLFFAYPFLSNVGFGLIWYAALDSWPNLVADCISQKSNCLILRF